MRRNGELVHKLFTQDFCGAEHDNPTSVIADAPIPIHATAARGETVFVGSSGTSAAPPIAYVPAPATIPQTTFPHPGKNFSIARAPSRKSIPTPTLAPSAAMNSVAARRLLSLPLMYMIPETI